MAFFNLKKARVDTATRLKKRDYHDSLYRNPLKKNENGTKRFATLKRAFALAAPFVLFIGVLYGVLFSGAFGVTTIEIEGAERTPIDALTQFTETSLNRRRFLILNQHRSLFVVDHALISARLTEHFALKAATVAPKLPHTIHIAIQERMPAFYVREVNGGGVLMDADGIIVAPLGMSVTAPPELLTLTVPVLMSTSTGDRLFDRSAMDFLRDVEASFPFITQGYTIRELDLERVLVHDITAKTSEPWVIYMSDTIDPRVQFLNVDRALQEMKEERKKIKYIDVRLPTKIFYK